MDVEHLMERLGRSGITVLLKYDHERAADGTRPSTLLLSGPGVGGDLVRAEHTNLGTCFETVVKRLRERPGDWAWLADLQ